MYSKIADIPIAVRQQLPRDAQEVFLEAAVVEASRIQDSVNPVRDIEHDCLVAGWAAVEKGWQKSRKKGMKWVKKPKKEKQMVHEPQARVMKFDEEQRIAYGWASVCTKNGALVEDAQGDLIEPAEMVRATTEFMEDVRLAKAMHDGEGIGQVVHSLPLTADLAKSLGIQTETEGWIVGVKIADDDTWAKVKDGTYGAFSIGGAGVREDVE